MSIPHPTLDAERERLAKMRDEFRLQLHLLSAELRDRFEDLEGRWHRLEGRLAVAGETAKEDSEAVGAAAQLLLDEIREGYEHLRSRL